MLWRARNELDTGKELIVDGSGRHFALRSPELRDALLNLANAFRRIGKANHILIAAIR